MPFLEFMPHPALRQYVDRLWLSTPEPGPNVAPSRILPDGCIDLHLHLEPIPRLEVVGTMTAALVLEEPSPHPIAAVRFKPDGAVPFLRVSAGELTDLTLDAADLGVAWLRAAPAALRSASEALRALENLLLRRLENTLLPDALVAHAVSQLLRRDAPTVAELARELGLSRQHLTRCFHAQVGIGPKDLARTARLQRAVTRLQAQPQAGLAGLAVELGFYDQAHLAKDLRELAGTTARAVREQSGSILPIRSLLPELESSPCTPLRTISSSKTSRPV